MLAVAVILIMAAIYYLESAKVQIPGLEGGINTIINKDGQFQKAPGLLGISGYLNGAPEGMQISDFKGKVVLVDFWTYTCINCIRTFPYLIEWHEKYADKGLVIIGVHTPEFEFEKDTQNVIDAMAKYGIEYYVIQDNEYQTWSAFRNRFWPHKYLIDAEGFIRYDHIGEGA
ncbi:MAG: redoxin domain-containing protein, partial [Candidatus Diapherotrites archaeon]|nr:redoxin domain-containing protein [Candidatus Diapherotrites archaeon]